MNNKPIIHLKNEVDRLAGNFGVPNDVIPKIDGSTDESRPYVLVCGDGPCEYHYIIKDYGKEVEHCIYHDEDSVLFRIFSGIANELAFHAFRDNRNESLDCRRFLFRYSEDLLGRLNATWKVKQELIHSEILQRAPYDDFSYRRANLVRELQKRGNSYDNALEEALRTYPFPIMGSGDNHLLFSL